MEGIPWTAVPLVAFLLAVPAVLLAWPVAAYISARVVQRKEKVVAVRFAVVVGVLSVFIGAIAGDLVTPLQVPEKIVSSPALAAGWVALPFLLVFGEILARRQWGKSRDRKDLQGPASGDDMP